MRLLGEYHSSSPQLIVRLFRVAVVDSYDMRFCRFYLLLSILATSTIQAACCSRFTWGGIELFAEYLLLRPEVCDLNYVIQDSRPFGDVSSATATGVDLFLPSGPDIGICPSFQSAFRLGGAFIFRDGCADFSAAYSLLTTRDKKRTSIAGDGGLWITLGDPQFEDQRLNNALISGSLPGALDALAAEKFRLTYQVADGVAAWRSSRGGRLFTRRYFGLRWMQLIMKRTGIYQGTITQLVNSPAVRIFQAQQETIKLDSRSWGIGPRVGADLWYEVGCGFSLAVHFGLSILGGECKDSQFEQVTRTTLPTDIAPGFNIDGPLDVRTRTENLLFPEFDARLGGEWRFCCKGVQVHVEAGWEFTSYLEVIPRVSFSGFGAAGLTTRENFSLNGFYLICKFVI